MTDVRKAALFLALAFGIGWSALSVAYLNGARSLGDAALAGVINVFSPSLAALICCLLFEKGRRREALGLRFRPTWWWLWAALLAAGLSAIAVVAANPGGAFTLLGAETTAKELAALLGRAPAGGSTHLWRSVALLPAALIAFALFFTFSEELGWRGYAYHLWRRFGFWRYSLGLGAVWGIWHWPIIYLFGLNYPDHRLFGLLIFPIYCALYSAPMTLVRDRGRSVVAPGIFHGVWNFLVALASILFVTSDSAWAKFGMGPCVAAAVGALLTAWIRLRDRTPVTAS